jgi:ribonuclease BN (tRNA processing enzyme)
MLEVCFLGTGGAVASEERDNSSFLIHSGGTLILVDCPGSVIQKIKKLDFDPRKINSILVTHIHPDHIYGLPSFVHSLMLDDCLIRLFGSEESVNFCQEFLDLFQLRDVKIRTRIEFIRLEAGEEFELTESVRCASLKVPHSASSLAYHFFFDKEKKELLYSGDTPPSPFLFQEAAGIDFLIHDCSAPSRYFEEYPSLGSMHTHSLELGSLSQEAKVKCLIPCHFFGELEFSISEIEKEIRENYRGRLVIPGDFARIAL